MSKITKNILDKIDHDHIKPRPKWQFAVMHGLVWALFGLSIIIGGFAVALVLHKLFILNDWGLVGRLPGGPVGGFFLVLPYLWFVILGVMIFIAYKIFEKTSKGYKFNPLIVLAVSIGLSIVLGSILFAVRAAHVTDDFMRSNIGPYREFQEFREKVWNAPEEGILPGRIVEIRNDSMILMDDVSGKTWQVDISKAAIGGKVILEKGAVVVAVGAITGEDKFKAEFLKPGQMLRNKLEKPPLKNGRPKPL